MSEACQHEDFEALVIVNRLSDKKQFAADVTIKCAHCHTAFRFLGLPGGISLERPTISFDGTEARLPIAAGGLYDE